MKKVLLAVLTIGTLASCSCQGVKMDWTRTKPHGEVTYAMSGFERINLTGSLDVKYMQADSSSVTVSGPVEAIKDVETRVEGNVLKIRMKGDSNWFNFGVKDTEGITVYVTSPDFLGISLQGSGDFECQGLLDTDNLDVELQGSGDVTFNDIICDKVNVSVLGSGDVRLKHVKALQSTNEVVGSGDIKIHYDNSGAVESTIVGSGDITLSGGVKSSKYEVRGSGDMHTNDLLVKEDEVIVK